CRARYRKDRTGAAGCHSLAEQARIRNPPYVGSPEQTQGSGAVDVIGGSSILRIAAAALRRKLAPLGQAGIRRRDRHLHPSRMHPAIRAAAQSVLARGELARRLFLSVPWFEI